MPPGTISKSAKKKFYLYFVIQKVLFSTSFADSLGKGDLYL